jgi:hypothetical protein
LKRDSFIRAVAYARRCPEQVLEFGGAYCNRLCVAAVEAMYEFDFVKRDDTPEAENILGGGM